VKNIVRRTTLIVRDIERSAQWYETVVGMTRYYDSEYILSGTGLPVGKEGDVTHLIIMQCEDPEIGMIGLLQWLDPPLPAPEIPTTITYGNPTFVCATDDAAEVHRRALEFGSRIHEAPHEWSTAGPDGKMLHFIGMSLFDPDGYFFQFNQLVADQ
jgi:catechol 2,3-dioxygenase-like lactoylglutathione lyase family enzyme